ncbi:MAG: fibronectin type III domain-containing protein, partial [Paludibacteraceae bacterium]|nr:fibronectin type III domain-containing protein [Paludibacteraceae bacterium]
MKDSAAVEALEKDKSQFDLIFLDPPYKTDVSALCGRLEKTPELPADRLADYCYTKMFAGCAGITEAPALTAYEMRDACYQDMFNSCVNLVKAPELLSTNLAQDCYKGMFTSCESLSYIKVGLKTLEDVTENTKDWVAGVDGPGVFIFPCGSRYDKHGASEVPTNFKIIGSPVAIFQNPDSTKLYIDTIDCGDIPVYRGIDPPSAGEGTVFLGWDKELTVIDEPDVYYYTALYEDMGDIATSKTLCFTAKSEDVSISIENIGGNNPNVEYSRNGGVTWATIKEGDVIEIPLGEKIHIKGSNPDGFSHGADKYTRFETSGKISVSGDVMSLIDGEGTSTEIPNEYCFAHLFENTTIIQSPTVSATTLKGSCYDHMFAGCEGLRRIPSLPAEKMYASCYSHMFAGCTTIDSIPQLPATEMAPYCYEYMFQGCVNIWNIDEILPAMQLAVGCYKGMFSGCEAMTFGVQLPALQLEDSSYAYMFYGCTSMRNSVWLPAEKLANYCYLSMYENSGILSCALMEAKELAENCCERMFKDCKNLISSPILHATVLKDSCYKEMFYGCVNLNHVEVEILTLDNDVDATKNWMMGVDGFGEFIFPCESRYDKHGVSEVPDNFTIISFPLFIYLNADGTELWRDTTDCKRDPVYGGEQPTYGEGMVFVGWDYQPYKLGEGGIYYCTAQYEKEEDVVRGPWLCFVAEEAGSKIWYTNQGENQPELLYSMDGGITWLPMEPSSATSPDNALTLTHEGAKVYIKGNNPDGFSHSASDLTYFGMSGRIAASGSVMSLIDTAGYITEIPCAHCFDSLFAGCEALTQAPRLPATQLTDYCYRNMFTHCTNLTVAPLLAAEETAEGCYSSMFSYCEKLTAVAGLADPLLKERCFESMYLGCSSLEEGYFELPSNELAESCYQGMFKDCINLKKAPILRATGFADHCYANMFEGCSSLTYIRVSHLTLDNDVDATKDWVKGVDSTGLFIFPCGSKYDKHGISEVPDKFIIQSSPIVVFQNPDGTELWRDTINCTTAPEYKGKEPTFGEGKVFLGWDKKLEVITEPTVHYYTAIYNTPAELDINKILCFTAEEANSQVWYTDESNCSPNLQYSTDEGKTWSKFNANEKVNLENPGDKVYVTGININGFHSTTDYFEHINFGMSGRIAASGSVMSLIDGTAETSVIPSSHCFHKLFANCDALTQAPELPATTLTENCYNNMFYGCTNLTKAPALPATTLTESCYSSMFSGCTSLTTAPELPAMDLAYACYQRMFSECTSLTTPPKLPATKLEIACYQEMFASSGLTSAPALPATKMNNQSYRGMFYRCLDLQKAPVLPAMELELGCYTAMFY